MLRDMIAQHPGNILAKTARGVGWIIGWRMATRLLGLANTLTLVHLLVPADFGLVALGSSFAFAVDTLSAVGVEDSLIREKSPSRELYDTGFTLNVLRGVASAAIIAATAVPVASFFGEPRLANVLLALAAVVVGTGLTNIGVVEFRRDLAFHKEFQLLLIPRVLSIVVAITVALIWRSYWALIAGILSGRLLGTAFSYVMHPYRPRLTLRGWRSLAEFSLWAWVISIATLIRDGSGNFVVGRVLGTTSVGVYEIGIELATLPTSELVGPLARATFPGFAAARHSGVDAAETFERVISAMILITLPAGIGISLVADPIVRLAFGPQWLEAIPLVQILGISGIVTVLGYVSSTLYSAHGLLRPILRILLIAAAARIILLVVLAQRFGLVGCAIAAAISVVLEHASYVIGTLHRFDIRASDLLKNTWRCVLATAVMATILLLTGLGWHAASGSRLHLARILIAAVATAVISYSSSLLVLWLAAGRPAGAERDLGSVVLRIVGRLGGWVNTGLATRRAGSRL